MIEFNQLPPECTAFIQAQIAAGRFADEREVLTAALTELKARQTAFARLRAHVAEGLAEADRGDFVDTDSIGREDQVTSPCPPSP